MILKILTIPGWVDKFYRLKSVQEFYDCMDVVYNFGDMCINKKMSEIQGKLESGDIQDEDAAEFLTFLISRDDINFKEITANLVELLMAAVETVWYNELNSVNHILFSLNHIPSKTYPASRVSFEGDSARRVSKTCVATR